MTQAQTVQPCDDDPAPPPPPPNHSHSNAAGWFFAAVLVGVLVFEFWAWRTKRPTISQWMRRKFGKHRLWRPVSIAIITVMMWHLFGGGPA